MTQVSLSVPEVHCDHCKSSLEGAVGSMRGVSAVDVSVAEATIAVEYDETAVDLGAIRSVIEEQGYDVAD
jgi:copper chaperone